MVTGFIQAAAFSIPIGQVNKLFGVSKEVPRGGFVGTIIDIIEELIAGNANWYDFGVGIGSIVILVILGKIKAYRIGYHLCRQHYGMGLSMFGTSNSGTDVTSAPSCELRHRMFNSAPSSVENLTSAPCKICVSKLMTFAEVNDLCRSSYAKVHPCRSSFSRYGTNDSRDVFVKPQKVKVLLARI